MSTTKRPLLPLLDQKIRSRSTNLSNHMLAIVTNLASGANLLNAGCTPSPQPKGTPSKGWGSQILKFGLLGETLADKQQNVLFESKSSR